MGLQATSTITGSFITLVQSKTAAASASSTSISVTLDDAPTANNLGILIVGFAADTNGLPTPPSGWTQAAAQNFLVYPTLTQPSLQIYYRVFRSGDPQTYTVTFQSSIAPSMVIAEYNGLDTSSPVDLIANNISVNSTSLQVGPTASDINQARELLIAAVTVGRTNGATSNWSFNNSFTLRDTITPTGGDRKTDLVWADRTVSIKDTYSTTATWTTAYSASGLLVTFKGSLSGIEVISAPSDSGYLVIHRGNIRNRASTETVVSLREGGSGEIRFTANLSPNGGQSRFSFGDIGWQLPLGTALGADISQGTVEINITDYDVH